MYLAPLEQGLLEHLLEQQLAEVFGLQLLPKNDLPKGSCQLVRQRNLRRNLVYPWFELAQ